MDIREDIKCHQDTLSYASSKVNYSVGQGIYMLRSDMHLKIKTGTVGYNNKILVSNGNFGLGKNDEVNLTIPAIKSHKTNSLAQKPNFSHGVPHKEQELQPITHNNEKVALVLFIAGSFAIWNIFDELVITILRTAVLKILYDSQYSLCSYNIAITILEMTPDVVYVPINFLL